MKGKTGTDDGERELSEKYYDTGRGFDPAAMQASVCLAGAAVIFCIFLRSPDLASGIIAQIRELSSSDNRVMQNPIRLIGILLDKL